MMRPARSKLSFVIACAAMSAASAPARELLFPPDAGVVDVRRDAGARGDGRTDDTAAIREAVKRGIQRTGRYASPAFVYFPAGTYLVTAPIESRVAEGGWSGGWRAGMILVGQDGTRSVIRLADRAPGYGDPADPRYVIASGSESDKRGEGLAGGGNRAFRHSVINLTVDTGTGNPGAVGIDYVASNRGTIEDVVIRSGDGRGFCGLRLERWWPGPALVKRVRIEGFDYGIRAAHWQYSMTFEHVTLKGQRRAGIWNKQNVLHIRGLVSENSVPAIEAVSGGGAITLMDSRLGGGAEANTAIVSKAKLFVRNLRSSGYGTVIRSEVGVKKDVPGGEGPTTVDEYTSHEVTSLFDGPRRSLRLPVEETPEFHTNDFARWESATRHGATPGGGGERRDGDDDAVGIQAAIDSGKEVVYLPNGAYVVRRRIVVRGGVRKIMGFQSSIAPPKGEEVDPLIRFEGGAADEVVLEHLRLKGAIEHASPRTLAIRHCDVGGYRNAPRGRGKLFLEDTIGPHLDIRHPQEVWCRQLNVEFGREPMIRNRGGTVWILGFKSEVGKEREHWTNVVNEGGRLELLGALIYPLRKGLIGDRTPCILNDRGSVSLTYAMNYGNYPVHVRERRADEWRELPRKAVPGRGPALYVGYAAE
jgi:hypothetical protein